MNKFINVPDSLGGLLGCLFWIAFFAGGAALFWAGLVRLTGLLR